MCVLALEPADQPGALAPLFGGQLFGVGHQQATDTSTPRLMRDDERGDLTVPTFFLDVLAQAKPEETDDGTILIDMERIKKALSTNRRRFFICSGEVP
jgi:hypothetical protein